MTKQIFSYSKEEDQLILDNEYYWACKQFFPKWDNSGNWTIFPFYYNSTLLGGVNYKEKKIYIHNDLLARDECKLVHLTLLRAVIIQEIVHAMLPKRFTHGKRFIETLLDCSVRAEQLGMPDLANDLSDDSFKFWFQKGRIVSTKGFYVKTRQLLQEDPETYFSAIHGDVSDMACVFCLEHVPTTFDEKIYDICREAYDLAKGKKLTNK